MQRNLCSICLAVAAKACDRIDRARDAYTDVFAGVQILERLFNSDAAVLASAQETARQGWEAVKSQSPGGLDVFDPEGNDPAAAWEQVIRWNSDLGSGHGLLAQSDAMLRLSLHFEHWIDRRGHPLGAAVESLIERCAVADASDSTEEESLLPARFLLTVGDALIETAQWELAAAACGRVLAAVPTEHHPLSFHASLQQGYARLMLGDVEACRESLNRVDGGRIHQLAELVVTVAAEAARYHALKSLWQRRSGQDRSDDSRSRIAGYLQRAAIISAPGPRNRVEYLRTLFFGLTARDVETMMRS